MPLLVLGTYRATEVDDDHPLATALHQLRRAKNVAELDVGPLAVEDLAELVSRRLGMADSAAEAAAVAEAIASRTDGHALFSEALVEAMADPRLDPVSRQALDTPTTVREFVGASVSRLSRPARSVLAAGVRERHVVPPGHRPRRGGPRPGHRPRRHRGVHAHPPAPRR